MLPSLCPMLCLLPVTIGYPSMSSGIPLIFHYHGHYIEKGLKFRLHHTNLQPTISAHNRSNQEPQVLPINHLH